MAQQPMAVTAGNVVRGRVDRGERQVRRISIVDPRTGQAAAPAALRAHPPIQVPTGFRTVPEERNVHKRSSSWDGMGRKMSPPRSPSPSVEGSPRVSRMTDEQLFHYVQNRTRNSPSPGRTVKYTRKIPPHSPTLKSRSPPEEYAPHTSRASSPRNSSAKKQLERELDEFCDELAEIHKFEDSIAEKISIMQISADGDRIRDGNKPGDVKSLIIGTPPQERFKSPKHNMEIVPPTEVVRPKTLSKDRLAYQPFKPSLGGVTSNTKIDAQKSAFFPAQMRSQKAVSTQ